MKLTDMARMATGRRPLGLGGILGAAIIGIVYLTSPGQLPGSTSLESTLLVGALVGGVCDAIILRPLFKRISFYSKLEELILLGNILGKRMQWELMKELICRYFRDPPP